MAIINLLFNNRALELSFIFLLVWYYCTLTIRESILKVNGSRIKGWWRTHHFISTVCAGVLLVWPQGEPWQLFRHKFMYFNAYISEYPRRDLIHCNRWTLNIFIYADRLRSISTVQVSEGSALQIEGTWWTAQHGYHHWRLSFVDVAWTKRSTAISFRWLRLPSLQFLDIVSIIIPQRCSVASAGIKHFVLYIIRWQHNNGKLQDCVIEVLVTNSCPLNAVDIVSCATKNSWTNEGTLPLDEFILVNENETENSGLCFHKDLLAKC